jgi:protein-L-isoaspartate(D-aspartate) O-methyltransferase
MDEVERARARDAMLEAIARDVRATQAQLGRSALDPGVVRALARVPRHEFVPAALRGRAYANGPLPIGDGQTISQPTVVAVMTELLELWPDARVLEIGAGSGYQSAVLAELSAAVYAIELDPRLAAEARERLARLGYANVELREGDGRGGWPERAPFDAVLVAAAAPEIPRALIDQLAPGGKLVAPRGPAAGMQELVLVEKDAHGRVAERVIFPVAFVPLRAAPRRDG